MMTWVLSAATLTGPLNAVAPNPVLHAELMAAIAAAQQRPLWPLRMPAALLRAALGELAELFVDGQRVVPTRPAELGFQFRYPTIAAALAALLAPSNEALSDAR
jgi:NAD dependent epimerase/dehydratase family enzyme